MANRQNLSSRNLERTAQKMNIRKDLQATEKQYRTLFETMTLGIVYQNKQGKIISANPAAERILGVTCQQMQGRTLMDPRWKATHEDGSEFSGRAHPSMIALRTGKSVKNTVMRVYNPKKKMFCWINVSAVPLCEQGLKKPFQVYTTFEDITERKLDQDAFIQNEKQLNKLYSSMNDGVCQYEIIYNRSGKAVDYKILDINPMYEKIIGVKKKNVVGKKVSQIYQIQKLPYLDKYAKVARTGKPVNFETYYPPGKKYFNISVFSPEKGKFAIIFFDISERKKAENALQMSEKKFRQVFETANVGKSLTLPSGEVEFNKAFCRMLGYTKKELRNKKWQELTPKEEIEPIQKMLDPILEGKKDEIRFIKRYIHKKGSFIWADVSTTLMRDNDNNPLYFITTAIDITTQQHIEEQLRETRDYLENLLDYANAPIIVWDTNFNIIRFNHAFEHLTGYVSTEVVGRKLDILFPPSSKGESINKIKRTLAGEYWEAVEIPVLRKDGVTRIALWNSANIYDKTNKSLVATIAQGQDITERKQTERELLRLASFPENNPNPIIEIDSNGHIFYVNRSAKVFFPDIERKGFDHPFLIDLQKYFTAFQKQEKDFIKQKYREIKIGENYYLQSFHYLPEWKRLRIYVTDITQRKKTEETLKESEEKYRTIVENTASLIMVTQPDGIISYLSPSCKDVLGHPAEELLGTNLNIFYPNDAEQVQKALSRALRGEKGSSFEYRIITKNGNTKWVSHSWSPIFTNGRLQCIVSIVDDITLRKEVEEKFQKLNEDLLRHSIALATVNKELEAFSYSVSHDLRAPLRTIDGFSQAILEDYAEKLDKQGQDYLQRVRKATQRMGQLIDDLLRLSRLSRAELTFEKVDLSGLANEVVEKLLATNPSRKIQTNIQSQLIGYGDRKLLEILFENLIGNAWKFTSNTNRPTIKIGELIKDNEHIFYVRDNGAGFDMAYVGKLFIPFQRLHSIDEYPGTGIGLALVSRIVHRHGGRIWAKGEVGKGATFYFTLQKKE